MLRTIKKGSALIGLVAIVGLVGTACGDDDNGNDNDNHNQNQNNNNNADPCVDDTTAPTVTVTPASPIELAQGTTTVDVTLSFSEAITGVDTTSVTVDNGATISGIDVSGNDYVVHVESLMEGITTLTVSTAVADECGNALEAPVNVSIEVAGDETPPTVVSTTPTDGATGIVANTSIVIAFSERINTATGSVEVTADGSTVSFQSGWTGVGELTVVPDAPLPELAQVSVTLADYEDMAGNVMASPYTFGFTIREDPCTGVPPTAALVNPNQTTPAVSGDAVVQLNLDNPFPMTESLITVTPAGGGANGTLQPGSLTGSGTSWSFVITGVANGETYNVAVSTATTPDACTTLAARQFTVNIGSPIPTGTGACTSLTTLSQHHVATDQCDEGTNSTFADAEDTGFTLVNSGDAFSIESIYDSDTIGGGDNDYFSFRITESGTAISEVEVTIAYGCSFTGTGTPGSYAPVLDFNDAGDTEIGTFDGNQDYDVINGSGDFGWGQGTFQVAGAAGDNTYVLQLDDSVGFNWCMDVTYFVRLVDNSAPAVCLGAPASVSLTNTTAQACNRTPTVLQFAFDDIYGTVQQSDLTLSQVSGTGSGALVPGSLTVQGNRTYTVELTGAADGDVYDLTIAGATNQCGTVFSGGTVTYTIAPASGCTACPLPPPQAQHHVALDGCNQGTNSTLADSEPTGFTLTAPGDIFSIGGIYDSDSIGGSDNDYFSFQVNENGTTLSDLQVTVYYGCSFQGSGNPGSSTPTIEIRDDSDNTVGAITGDDPYDTLGTGDYGSGTGPISVGGAAGLNTYHVYVEGDGGSDWCGDYQIVVEHTDDTRLIACQGIPGTVQLASTTGEGCAGTTTRLGFGFDYRYTGVQESDLSLSVVSGSGSPSLVAGSLTFNGSSYSVDITGAVAGDVYQLDIAGSSDPCASFAGGSVTYTINNEDPCTVCPLPPPKAQHHVASDLCGQETNSDITSSEPSGFTLATPGEAFSIRAIYDSDGSDNDYFSFAVDETGTTLTDLQVSIYYGCSFTGSTPSSYAPEVEVRDDSDNVVATITGDTDYDVVDGSGRFGTGSESLSLTGPAGTNTYHLRVDDVVGSGWCMDYMLVVEHLDNTRPPSCLGIEPVVQLTSTTGEACERAASVIFFDLDETYDAVQESDLSLSVVSGTGSPSIVSGSLTHNAGTYSLEITGAVAGDVYRLDIGSSSNACSSFAGGAVQYTVVDAASCGICPLPPPETSHHVATDGCDEETNGSLAASEPTGFTLATPGDAFTIDAILDSDTITTSDNDFFSFQLTETGTTLADLRVSIAYGCSFSGSGTPGSYAPEIEVRDASDNTIITFSGADDYNTLTGNVNLGRGESLAEAAGAAGTNTYHLVVDDDDYTSNWCMDYQLRVELVDNTRPLSCQGTPGTVQLTSTAREACAGSPTRASFTLDYTYTGVQESDLSLTVVSGTGTPSIVNGSLVQSFETYTFEIAGAVAGDVYLLDIAPSSDSCASFPGGSVTYTIAAAAGCTACPFPAALSNHHTAADACDQATNQDIGTSEPTGFTLAAVGDAFSLGGIYDSTATGGDNDYFSFGINATGSNDYLVQITAYYGCSFTGSDTPGAYVPEYQIRNDGDTSQGSVFGDDDYSAIDGSGNYGSGSGTILIPASELPAGASTFHVWMDDDIGLGWCMDYLLYVELVAIQ